MIYLSMMAPLSIVFMLLSAAICSGFRHFQLGAFRGHQGFLGSKVPISAPDEVEIDYDAPLERLIAVGAIVRSGEGGTLDHEIIVDDDCYTGKDPNNTECIDFDPIHTPRKKNDTKAN